MGACSSKVWGADAHSLCGLFLAHGELILAHAAQGAGPVVGELLKGMRPRFARVTSFKPQSSRVESKETFFVGLGFKGKEADGARD